MSTADYDVGVEKTASEDRPVCGLATASMIFGILSFLVLPFCGGLIAIVLGWHARTRIRESGGHLGGEARAAVGISLGSLNLIFSLLLAGFFVLVGVSTWRSIPTYVEATAVTIPSHPSLEPGVKMANEISREEYDLIEKLHLAAEDDPVVCIYTAEGNTGNPEMAVLTTKRIAYIKDGRITPLPLSEIASILDQRKYQEKYHPQSVGFDTTDRFNVEIIGKDGTRMRVVIRPGLDGPPFYEALNDTWKAAGGGETATKPEPQ